MNKSGPLNLTKIKEKLLKTLSLLPSIRFFRTIFLSLLTGLVAGLGAIAIYYSLETGKEILMHGLAGYEYPHPAGEGILIYQDEEKINGWLFFFLPLLGGLIAGIFVFFLAPEAAGGGADAVFDAFHNKKGIIRSRVPFVKSIASIITLSSGGSAGREGPISQIGGGLGSIIAQIFKLNAKDRRRLLIAGSAGGLGAIFRAPLGGALTAIETIYIEDFETESLIHAIISSVTAYTLFTTVFGMEPIFGKSADFVYQDPKELIFYLILGILCVPVGALYTWFFHRVKWIFAEKIPLPDFLKPALGGLLVGVVGYIVYLILGKEFWGSVYSTGWGYIQIFLNTPADLETDMMWKLILTMLLIMFCKILTTSFTVYSGGSGGIFGPTLFIGGMLGGIVGYTSHIFFPDIIQHPQAFIMVGMASFFAGVANAPISSLIMICELVGNYNLILPLLLVNAIALVFTRKWYIFPHQVLDKFHSPAHMGDFTMDILEKVKVKDAFKASRQPIMVNTGTTLAQFQHIFQGTRHAIFPVVDEDGKPLGILHDKDVRVALFDKSIQYLVVVDEIMSDFISVHLDNNLHEALIIFLEGSFSELPITDEEDQRIIGTLEYNDLIAEYHSEVIRSKSEQ